MEHGNFPKIVNLKVTDGYFENSEFTVDLVPLIQVDLSKAKEKTKTKGHWPNLFCAPKDNLPNLSMPLDFTQFERDIILDMPNYMRQGVRLIKMVRKKKNISTGGENVLTSYMIKTSLLIKILDYSDHKFKTDQQFYVSVDNFCAGVFWAKEILENMLNKIEARKFEFRRFGTKMKN